MPFRACLNGRNHALPAFEEAAGSSQCVRQSSNVWTAGWLREGSGLLVVAEEGPVAHFLIYLDGQIHFLVDIVVSCDICTPYIIIVTQLGLIGLNKSSFRMKWILLDMRVFVPRISISIRQDWHVMESQGPADVGRSSGSSLQVVNVDARDSGHASCILRTHIVFPSEIRSIVTTRAGVYLQKISFTTPRHLAAGKAIGSALHVRAAWN
jgi:hypothetical protein